MMKQMLSVKQSAELIKRGVNKDKASYDSCATSVRSTIRAPIQPIFTLTDLLTLLPKDEHDLGGIMVGFDVERGKWASTYEFSSYMAREDELIDSLYKLVLHLLDNHVKLD